MAVVGFSSPFGSGTRTRTLVTLRLVGESYPRELARLLDARLSTVQKALQGLERDGLVAGRSRGRTRLYRLDPSYFAIRELEHFLIRLADAHRTLHGRVGQVRRRPRRTGKPL